MQKKILMKKNLGSLKLICSHPLAKLYFLCHKKHVNIEQMILMLQLEDCDLIEE